MIGGLLGHATVKSTTHYAHLDDLHLVEAAELIGNAIEAALRPHTDIDSGLFVAGDLCHQLSSATVQA